jgi:DNA-binding MarR family transcriptional regulator
MATQVLASDREVRSLAADLRVSIGLLVRRLRAGHDQRAAEGELTMPETSALARLDRGGPATSAELARAEQISPQSMGATLAALEQRGLLVRTADPNDGRRQTLSVSPAGISALSQRRQASVDRLATALTDEFTPAEIKTLRAAAPLIERLAQSL